MAESAGSLSFGFEADFSGFTRAAEGAGKTLDALTRTADGWAQATATSLSRTLGAAAAQGTARTGELAAATQAMADRSRAASGTIGRAGLSTAQVLAGVSIPDTSGDKDDDSAKVLTRLSEQLALLKTTGAAHDAIVERMKIEAEQAKLGTDATAAEKAATADLVKEIDAAATAHSKLKAAADATNEAVRFGSAQAARGVEALILDGARLDDVAAGLLRSVARQGLQGALAGGGPFAGLFGTATTDGSAGGLFGAIGKALTGGASSGSGFSGLYADGGTIGAGQWGIVGERGAEVVAGPATVLPMGGSGGAGQGGRAAQVINFNVTTPDAASFARSQGQVSALLARAVARGQRNL